LVGRDVRESSPEILDYLIKGITDAGADVHYAGLATTPMIYYSTAKFGFDASVMITASHNPAEYKRLKVSGTQHDLWDTIYWTIRNRKADANQRGSAG
jgi:phosphomannomutase